MMNNQLHTACQKGKVKLVKELLNDENIKTSINVRAGVFGYTPLHEATSSGKAEIIELLLECGANVDAKSNGRYTSLHIAATIGDLRCIEALLKNNADVLLTDEFEKTPHKTAELNRQRQAARLLKTAGNITSSFFYYSFLLVILILHIVCIYEKKAGLL